MTYNSKLTVFSLFRAQLFDQINRMCHINVKCPIGANNNWIMFLEDILYIYLFYNTSV